MEKPTLHTAYDTVMFGLEHDDSKLVNEGITEFIKCGFTTDRIDKFLIKLLQMRPDFSSKIIPLIHKKDIYDNDCMIEKMGEDGHLLSCFEVNVFRELTNSGFVCHTIMEYELLTIASEFGYIFDRFHKTDRYLAELREYLIKDDVEGIQTFMFKHCPKDTSYGETSFIITLNPIIKRACKTSLLGLTVLFNAMKAFKTLLMCGVDIRRKDEMSILDLACYTNNIDVVHEAVNRGVKPTMNTVSVCVLLHRNEIMEWLYNTQYGLFGDIYELTATMLAEAARANNYHIMNLVANSVELHDGEIFDNMTDQVKKQFRLFMVYCVISDDYETYKFVCDNVPRFSAVIAEFNNDRFVYIACSHESENMIKYALKEAAVKVLDDDIKYCEEEKGAAFLLKCGIRPTVDTTKMYYYVYKRLIDWCNAEEREIINVFIKSKLDKWNGMFAHYGLPYHTPFNQVDAAIMNNDIEDAQKWLDKGTRPTLRDMYDLEKYIKHAFEDGHTITGNLKDDVDIWRVMLKDDYNIMTGGGDGGKRELWMFIIIAVAVIVIVVIIVNYERTHIDEVKVSSKNQK